MSESYISVSTHWRDLEQIFLLDPSGSYLGVHSQKFLSASNVNNGRYLMDVLKSIATFPEDTVVLDLTRSIPLRMQSPIEPGKYQVQCDPALFTLKVGPIKRFLRSANKAVVRMVSGVPTISTTSSSSNSSQGQSDFRETLFLRDKTCLISQTKDRIAVQACHVVPFAAGPEFWQKLLSPDQPDSSYDLSYHPENGLLLSSTLHKFFDCYDIGLYYDYQRKAVIVHDFTSEGSASPYHGKIIPFHDLQIPNVHPKVLQWHYSQCLMKHVRTFSVENSDSVVQLEQH